METANRTSRRSLLTSATAAAAAAIATAIGRPLPSRAVDGDPLILGETSETRAETRVHRTTSGPALTGQATGPGVGLLATTETGIAIQGVADSGNGILGFSDEGSAIEALSRHGAAIRIRRGRFVAEGISGRAIVRAGETETFVRPTVTIPPGAFVLLSPMSALGGRDLWFTTQPSDRTITIHLSEPSSEDLRVGWLLVG